MGLSVKKMVKSTSLIVSMFLNVIHAIYHLKIVSMKRLKKLNRKYNR